MIQAIAGMAESEDEKGAGCLKLRFNASCFSATPCGKVI
jgi:hypothetical protein